MAKKSFQINLSDENLTNALEQAKNFGLAPTTYITSLVVRGLSSEITNRKITEQIPDVLKELARNEKLVEFIKGGTDVKNGTTKTKKSANTVIKNKK